VWAIVVAAGSGQRFGRAKQFEALGPVTVVDHALAVARAVVDGVVLVVPADHAPERPTATTATTVTTATTSTTGTLTVTGGSTRSESVRCGLAAVPDDAEIVLVHDGARPFASAALYRAVIAAIVDGADGAVPGVPLTDTVKVVDRVVVEGARTVLDTPDRATLVAVQTPQAFRATALRAAHADATEGTDDAALVERQGGRVVVVAGEADNRKLTVAEDLDWARRRLAGRREGES
jgi:2-C-methyl-D-erythritol 4-phosphate cytidylyltransferase